MIGSENIANSWKEIERAYIVSLFRLTKTNMILLNSDKNETMCIAKPDERKDKSLFLDRATKNTCGRSRLVC